MPPLPSRPGSRPGSRPPSAHSLRPRALSKPRLTQVLRQQQDEPLPSPRAVGDLPPQSPQLPARTLASPLNPGSSQEDDSGTTATHRPVRSRSVASRMAYRPPQQDASRDAFTPPASPGIGPSLSPFPNLTPRRKTFDPAPSPSTTIHTRTSVISNLSHTSSSSSALLGSLDSLVIAEDEPMSIPPFNLSPTANDGRRDSLIGVEELLRESANFSEHRKSRPANPRIPDCAIRVDSTYYKLKGLCRGATRFRKDGHWGSIKLTSEYEYGGGMTGGGDMMRASDGLAVPFQYEIARVGACGDCGYGHDLDEVEIDRDDKRTAPFSFFPRQVANCRRSRSSSILRIWSPLPPTPPLQVPSTARKQHRNSLRLPLVRSSGFNIPRRRCHRLSICQSASLPPGTASTATASALRRQRAVRTPSRSQPPNRRPSPPRVSNSRTHARKRRQTGHRHRSQRPLPTTRTRKAGKAPQVRRGHARVYGGRTHRGRHLPREVGRQVLSGPSRRGVRGVSGQGYRIAAATSG